jgi:hypothetical protein
VDAPQADIQPETINETAHIHTEPRLRQDATIAPIRYFMVENIATGPKPPSDKISVAPIDHWRIQYKQEIILNFSC